MLHFKIADRADEFEQIHRLNHRTFAGEIPQHDARPDGRLVDRFHEENTYAIAVRGGSDGADAGRVVGMSAWRGRRPFSLDGKLPDLDEHLARLPPHRRACEIRLLAVEPSERGGAAFRGLVETLLGVTVAGGYDLAVISGTPRQARLYAHLGFEPFGPRVGTDDAPYQPMALTGTALGRHARLFRGRPVPRTVNLLPGPVPLSDAVRAAARGPAVSHREPAFRRTFDELRDRLCRAANANAVQVLAGTGTAANDAVAAQLAARPGPGLVLANGEFGDRLADHAARQGLNHAVLRHPWGRSFAPEDLADECRRTHPRWIWAVHAETSTGGLNGLPMLTAAAAGCGAELAVDAVSSFGAVPVDLEGVALATAVSGKSLGAPAGLSFVFHRDPPAHTPRVPRSLDLALHAAADGIPFTLPSGPVHAAAAAMRAFDGAGRFAEIAGLAKRLNAGLAELGLAPVAGEPRFAGVTTFAVPEPGDAGRWVGRLARRGFAVNRSGYLNERNWVQCATLGRPRAADVDRFVDAVREIARESPDESDVARGA